jgi:hypothetical protein
MRAPGTPQCALAAHAQSQTRAPKLPDDAENLLRAPETASLLHPESLGAKRLPLPPVGEGSLNVNKNHFHFHLTLVTRNGSALVPPKQKAGHAAAARGRGGGGGG